MGKRFGEIWDQGGLSQSLELFSAIYVLLVAYCTSITPVLPSSMDFDNHTRVKREGAFLKCYPSARPFCFTYCIWSTTLIVALYKLAKRDEVLLKHY